MKKIRFELMKHNSVEFTIQCFKPLNYFLLSFLYAPPPAQNPIFYEWPPALKPNSLTNWVESRTPHTLRVWGTLPNINEAIGIEPTIMISKNTVLPFDDTS